MGDRHPATTGLLRWFSYSHLPADSYGRAISQAVHDVAHDLVGSLPDGPELTTGLRKLLEAKDCFVRAAIDKQQGDEDGTLDGSGLGPLGRQALDRAGRPICGDVWKTLDGRTHTCKLDVAHGGFAHLGEEFTWPIAEDARKGFEG